MSFEDIIEKYHLIKDGDGNYYRLDENGQREEIYAAILTISKILGINKNAIKKRIRRLRPVSIKPRTGQIVNGYNINEVKQACADILDEIPLTDGDGVAMINGQPYAAIHPISKMLGISKNAINKRLGHLIPVRIKVRNGNIFDSYNINEVKQACADLLNETPLANEDGIAMINGQPYATIATISKSLNIGALATKKRLGHLIPVRIKLHVGKIFDGYNINEVKKSCADILDEIPLTDEGGVAIINSQPYATIYRISKMVGISERSIKIRIGHLIPVRIKGGNGTTVDGYNINKVKQACADILDEIPLTDEGGVAIINSQPYATIYRISKMVGIDGPAIKIRIGHLIPVRIKLHAGQIVDGYNINEVRHTCADLLEKKARKGE